MTRKKKTTTNEFATPDDIKAMLSAPEEVTAAGLRFQLQPPTAAEAMAIRDWLFSEVKQKRESGVLFQAARMSLKACLGMDLNEDEAARLIMRTGGESGLLAQTAMRLCGLDSMFSRKKEAEAVGDPTPFLLREKPVVN